MASRAFEAVGALVLAIGMGVPAEAQTGTIHFPTSASPAAQEHSVAGVKILHSFGFEDAIEHFLNPRPFQRLLIWAPPTVSEPS